mmetsp:Transcript_54109/g.139359  ORF Transcript_54109/g.139359 Transcript_54109/m.139359 type:complete len:216 (-) Transcript_54109:1077-1724(-)
MRVSCSPRGASASQLCPPTPACAQASGAAVRPTSRHERLALPTLRSRGAPSGSSWPSPPRPRSAPGVDGEQGSPPPLGALVPWVLKGRTPAEDFAGCPRAPPCRPRPWQPWQTCRRGRGLQCCGSQARHYGSSHRASLQQGCPTTALTGPGGGRCPATCPQRGCRVSPARASPSAALWAGQIGGCSGPRPVPTTRHSAVPHCAGSTTGTSAASKK